MLCLILHRLASFLQSTLSNKFVYVLIVVIHTVVLSSDCLPAHADSTSRHPLKIKGYHVTGGFGKETGKFLLPSIVRTSVDGSIYVLDTGKRTVTKISEQGEPLWEVDGGNLSEDGFVEPIDMTNSDGFYFYVLDRLSRSIFALNSRGEIRRKIKVPSIELPRLIRLWKAQTLLVYDGNENAVKVIDLDGQVVLDFSLDAVKSKMPLDIRVYDGRIFILYDDPAAIASYDSIGRFMNRITLTVPNVDWITPRAFGFDDSGRVYVCDQDRNEVNVFSSTFEFELGISDLFPLIQFSEPSDVIVNSKRVFVADSGTARIIEIEIAEQD